MQRPARRALHHRRLGLARLGERAVGGEMKEGVKRAVESLDPRETGMRELDRRELALGDERRGLGDGREIAAHDARLSSVKIVAGSASSGSGA